MLSREKLLHPATVIATIALFVALGGATYAASTIATRNLRNGAVTAAKLRNGAVTGAKIKNGAISRAKLARGAVGSAQLAAGAVGAAQLAPGTVGAGALQPGSVGTTQLANEAVTAAKLATDAVTTVKIAGAAVTSAKLATAAVGTTQIADLAVTTEKIAGAAVTGGKIAPATITGANIAPATITASNIAPNQVVLGTGSLLTTRQDVANGAVNQTLLSLPGLGTLRVSCVAGLATTNFVNETGGTATVENWGVNNGAPDAAFIDRNNPPNGGVITATNGGNGPQSVEWQVSFTDAGGGAHAATMWVTVGANLTNCQAAAQAITTG